MAKKKGKKITAKALEKTGRIEFTHTDSYGITYEMKLFQIGWCLTGRVLAPDGTLLHHTERSCPDFEHAQLVWDATCDVMTDERVAIHKKFAEQAAKASGTSKSEVVTKQSENCLVTTAEPTLADRLREVLLQQIKQAT